MKNKRLTIYKRIIILRLYKSSLEKFIYKKLYFQKLVNDFILL